MKLKPRVINLGNGYGKVVRYFQEREPSKTFPSPHDAIFLYRFGYIDLNDFYQGLLIAGFSCAQLEIYKGIAEGGF